MGRKQSDVPWRDMLTELKKGENYNGLPGQGTPPSGGGNRSRASVARQAGEGWWLQTVDSAHTPGDRQKLGRGQVTPDNTL